MLDNVVNFPSPREQGYPVQNGIDEKANNGQEDEEDDDDDGDGNISFNHFAAGLFRSWLTETDRKRLDTTIRCSDKKSRSLRLPLRDRIQQFGSVMYLGDPKLYWTAKEIRNELTRRNF